MGAALVDIEVQGESSSDVRQPAAAAAETKPAVAASKSKAVQGDGGGAIQGGGAPARPLSPRSGGGGGGGGGATLASPAVRALARGLGVDLSAVPPSGADGRVVKDDVVRWWDRGGEGAGSGVMLRVAFEIQRDPTGDGTYPQPAPRTPQPWVCFI